MHEGNNDNELRKQLLLSKKRELEVLSYSNDCARNHSSGLGGGGGQAGSRYQEEPEGN